MAKRSSKSVERVQIAATMKATVGIDVGDRWSECCAVGEAGQVVERFRVKTTPAAFEQRFAGMPRLRLVLEAGVHSAWLAELLERLGHEVLVANPRRLRLISQSRRKDDRTDAETLARLGRMDPRLLAPLRHAQASQRWDQMRLRSHDALVRARTALINHVRGVVKSCGERVPSCSAPALARRARQAISPPLEQALEPVLKTIEALTEHLRAMEREIERRAEEAYPHTRLLRQVKGVGAKTALAYALKIEDPRRFKRSRTVGAYLGLVPARRRSGEADPHLRITKEGDPTLRRLLVGSAQYILGPFGPDCDLRRQGLSLAGRGGKAAKRKAVVATARKLAVLLHRLWRNGEVYEPLRLSPQG